jgi:hypothetical protein
MALPLGDANKEQCMAKVLVIGLDPDLIDFSQPPLKDSGLNADKIRGGLEADRQRIEAMGHEAAILLVDDGATAEQVARDRLTADRPDVVVIGAGIRTVPAYFELFEKLINVVHAAAPQARIAFNTNPANTAEAVQRWV